MTALKQEAIHLTEQMPETNSKMEAFLELEKMLFSVPQDLDYDKELAEARNEKYGIKNNKK